MKDTLEDLLKSKISVEDSAQTDLPTFIRKADFFDKEPISRILDLGCGDGRGYEALKNPFPKLVYYGLDIEASPEVSSRERTDLDFYSYDGVNIPFEDNYFDAIYCRQVLEHVREPDAVIAEAARVLKSGAWFLGSVSQLEPYHSHSIFNWTAYGVIQVFESHGMEVVRLAPGVDGITLTLRRLLGFDKFSAFFAKEGLFNHYIEQQLRANGRNVWRRNYLKLVCAGHIVFAARKL